MIGDLVFIRENTPGAWLIRFWSRKGAPEWEPEGFNHVAIMVGPDEWLSAEPTGIKRRTLSWLKKRARKAMIMRFAGRPAGIATQARINRAGYVAAQYAIALAEGQPYDFLGVVGFCVHRLLGVRVDWGNRWFCSELCMEAYVRAFTELGIPHSYQLPADTTPNDLARWALANGFQ